MKNVFCFMLKSLFFLRCLNFVLTFLAMMKNGLIRKLRLIQNLWCHRLGKKKLQYAYCPVSQEVAATRQ